MGTFIHHPDGHFIINGEKFSEEVFLSVQPDYEGSLGRYYKQGKHPTWTQGDIYINRLSDFQAARADDRQADSDAKAAAKQAIFDDLDPAEKRRLHNPSNSTMIEALWRHIVEGEDLDISGCNAIQAQRDAVQRYYPDA